MNLDKKPRQIYLIAGEASGDFLGAQLMKALKQYEPDIKFSGIGGPLMQREGLKSLFDMQELSVMGIMEVLPKVGKLLGRIKETAIDILAVNPDIVVTIDAPDFSFRVHQRVRHLTSTPPKLVHYVAPTVWAWRPKRAMKIAGFLDALICLFDFEPAYFEVVGLRSIAVGHPMMESGIQEAEPILIGDKSKLNLGIFLGSRRGEIKRVAPKIIKAVKRIHLQYPDIELIVPTLPHLENRVKELILPLDIPCCISTDQNDKWGLFKACDVAIAVSGTVGLELAAANVPHVIAYKANPVTAFFIRRMLKTPFVHLANIIAKKEVVPEFIQERCTVENISNTVVRLLDDPSLREKQQNKFQEVRERIGSEKPPSNAAAEYLLSL